MPLQGVWKGMCFRGTGQECFPYPCLCPCHLVLVSTWMWTSVAVTGAASYLQTHSLVGAQEEHRALKERTSHVNAFRIWQIDSYHAMKAMFYFLAPNHVPNPRSAELLSSPQLLCNTLLRCPILDSRAWILIGRCPLGVSSGIFLCLQWVHFQMQALLS